MLDTLESIVEEFAKVFEPVSEAFKSERLPYGPLFLLRNAGIIENVDLITEPIDKLVDHIRPVARAVNEISSAITRGDIKALLSSQGRKHFEAILKAIRDANKVRQIRVQGIEVTDAGERFLDYLIITYAARHRPDWYTFAQLVGAIRMPTRKHPEPPSSFASNAVTKFFLDPAQWYRDEFDWGVQRKEFLFEDLALRLKLLLDTISLHTYLVQIPDKNGEPTDIETRLMVPFFHVLRSEETVETGLMLSPAYKNGRVNGVKVGVYGAGGLQRTQQLGDNWEVQYSASAAAGFAIEFIPGNVRLNGGNGQFTGRLYVGKTASESPWRLLGSESGTRIEIGAIGTEVSALLGHKKNDAAVEVFAKNARFIIKPSDGDGILQKLLPSKGFVLDFDASVGWSHLDGFFFGGSAGFDISIPIHKEIGPVKLRTLTLGLTLSSREPSQVRASISFSAALGPVTVSLAGVGMALDWKIEEGGNLGLLDIEGLGLTSPNLIAASIDSGIISGGGALFREDDRYAGILALDMKALSVTGIALISKRMPDGSPGFSMLVSLNAVFRPAIQLSFGFTLSGVGGLIGINRTMKVDALKERIAEGAINSIMFPENPIENAERIISDLRAVFPPLEKHYVIGPFLRIGFGTPPIVEVDLGVFLEFPFNGRIILLGSLGVYLPVKNLPLVEIHVDIIGDFNIPERYIRLEGRLRQSHILGITLKGGFAFMVDWGRRPAFLFSIGGYHPRYKKTARFPDIPRLQALVRLGSIVRLSCKYYQAITSNSFQIGFSAFLKVSAAGASLEGRMSFNALLQFNPFFFSTDQSLSVKLKFKGATLMGVGFYFLLSGPSPWTAVGYAEVTILMFTLKVRFRVQFGRERREPKVFMTVTALLDQIGEAFKTDANWKTSLPSSFRGGEALRALEEGGDGLVLHPSGQLQVSQGVAPLYQTIEKVGNTYIKGKPVFTIKKVSLGDVEVQSDRAIHDSFSPGYFQELSNIEKLTAPDFEEMKAGFSLGSSQADGIDIPAGNNDFVEAPFEAYETIRLDVEKPPQPVKLNLKRSPISDKMIAIKEKLQRDPLPWSNQQFRYVDKMPVLNEKVSYKLVERTTLAVQKGVEGNELTFSTYSEARQYLRASAPGKQDSLSIRKESTLETVKLL